MIHLLTLQRLKFVGFLCTQTSNYTRKHRKLICFHKTFTTKDTFVSISDSIRLVSKPTANLLFVFIRTLNILHQKGFSSSNRLYSVVENNITHNIDFCKKKVLSIPHINEWDFRTFIVIVKSVEQILFLLQNKNILKSRKEANYALYHTGLL